MASHITYKVYRKTIKIIQVFRKIKILLIRMYCI